MPSQHVRHKVTDSLRISLQSSHYEVSLAYNINQPMESNAWDSEAYSISIFGFMEFLEIDAKNIYTLLLHMENYIRLRKIKLGLINDIFQLKDFGEAIWNFISSIYKSIWNTINADINNNSFRSRVTNKFTPRVPKTKSLSNSSSSTNKKVEVVKLSPSIPICPSKEVLEKSRLFGKGKRKKSMSMNKVPQKQSYTQVAGLSILDILKLKENYLNLPAKKIKKYLENHQ